MAIKGSKAKFTAIIVASIFAGATAGWIGRGAWDVRNLDRDILAAYAKVKAPAKMEIHEDLGVVVVRGKKSDVEQTTKILDEVRKAVQK